MTTYELNFMEVNNGYGINLWPLVRGSRAAKFRLLLLPQHHFDSRTLRFEFFNGVANFAVTTRKYFFLLFFNFCSWKYSFICTLRKKNIQIALLLFFSKLFKKSGNLGHSSFLLFTWFGPLGHFLKKPFKSRISRRGVIRDKHFV